MKIKTAFIFLALISLLAAASASLADGMLYPIGQQPQPSYPVPQYNPYGQQQPQQPYNPPYQPYQPQQPQPQPYQPPKPQPQQPPKPQPQPQQPKPQPFYDPRSHLYFYPIGDEQPWYQVQPQPWQQNQPQPWQQNQPQPWQQNQPQSAPRQDANVQVSTKWGKHNSVDLTWTIRNITNENWGRNNVDILCVNGCHLLTDQNRTRWDIPRTVNRNDTLTFTVNIRQPRQGDTMTFSMVAGSKTLYTFNVRL